jgi:hypothetical protein
LADGLSCALSPDGKWAVVWDWPAAPAETSASTPPVKPRYVLVPAGTGEPRGLDLGVLPFTDTDCSNIFFAHPKGIFVPAAEPGRPKRTFLLDSDGPPRPVTPEGITALWKSQLGDTVIGRGPDWAGPLARYPIGGGDPRPLPVRIPEGWGDVRASRDGRSLLIMKPGVPVVHVERLDLTTGARTPWKTLRPDDPAGIYQMGPIDVSDDESTYAYGYGRVLQDLWVAKSISDRRSWLLR